MSSSLRSFVLSFARSRDHCFERGEKVNEGNLYPSALSFRFLYLFTPPFCDFSLPSFIVPFLVFPLFLCSLPLFCVSKHAAILRYYTISHFGLTAAYERD